MSSTLNLSKNVSQQRLHPSQLLCGSRPFLLQVISASRATLCDCEAYRRISSSEIQIVAPHQPWRNLSSAYLSWDQKETKSPPCLPTSLDWRGFYGVKMCVWNRKRWDDTTLIIPKPKDAALLMKLDFTLLPYFSIIWFLFGLSRASYSSAYISGMKDDLGFKGKDFNYMTTTYLVIYAVCQIPGTSLLTIYSPTYVFVAANLTWSVLVSGLALTWSKVY